MIVTTTRFQVDESSRRELFQTIRSLYQLISQERGSLACHFYCEVGNEAMLLIVEEWESERHWRDHLQSREFAVFVGAMILVEKPVAVEFKLLSEISGVDSLKKMRAYLAE